jgi:DNA polymerase V
VITGVQAGFPSPAGDYMEPPIDLNEHIIEHPAATFFMRATGESMIGAHILPGALLVVDRALRPKDGSIVVAVVDGEFTCKRVDYSISGMRLLSENPKFKPIIVTEFMQVEIWGVVRAIVIDKPL